MQDTKTTVADLKALAERFVHEREWRQFHGAKNMSMSIAVEAAELMELFIWAQNAEQAAQIVQEKKQAVTDELADILNGVLLFADEFAIDLSSALKEKIAKNAEKYPLEKSKGVNKKYTDL